MILNQAQFARQRWRAWIETRVSSASSASRTCSPVSDGGRGLKHDFLRLYRIYRRSPVSDGGRGLKPYNPGWAAHKFKEFARQRWRAWIETFGAPPSSIFRPVRPSAMAGVD